MFVAIGSFTSDATAICCLTDIAITRAIKSDGLFFVFEYDAEFGEAVGVMHRHPTPF